MLVEHHEAGRVIGAICLSPALVLEPAGVLANATRVTCNPLPIRTDDQSWPADEFTRLLGDKFDPSARVCVDEANRIIIQTPGTAIEYALALVAMLRGRELHRAYRTTSWSDDRCPRSIDVDHGVRRRLDPLGLMA